MMNIKQQRQELILIIHMMKIILVYLEKSAGTNPQNRLKARVRSLEISSRKTVIPSSVESYWTVIN